MVHQAYDAVLCRWPKGWQGRVKLQSGEFECEVDLDQAMLGARFGICGSSAEVSAQLSKHEEDDPHSRTRRRELKRKLKLEVEKLKDNSGFFTLGISASARLAVFAMPE